MSEEKSIFERNDFKNIYFYYFLPFYNYVKKVEIGEKINQFNGNISITLKENIYILIEKESDILSDAFRDEILSTGKVSLYIDNTFVVINCLNEKIDNPMRYNCLLLNDFFKIVEKFDTQQETFKFFVNKGVNPKINKESLIAVYLKSNNYQKIHLHEFPVIKENKWRNGAITKYDIPQYIRNIPEEYPAICTIKEAGILKNNKKKEEKEKEKEKKKQIQLDLEMKNNSTNREKENDTTKNNNNQNASKNNESPKEKKVSNINNILEEPIPNDMHKYCHLCKKQFDNYLRHINSKNHKETALKYNDTFASIKNAFNRINTFWGNKQNNNNSNNQKKNAFDNISQKLNDIEEKIEFDKEEIKQRMMSQFNQGTREGCKAKRKIIIPNNSQLSTAQSSPMVYACVNRNRKRNRTFLDKGKSKSKKTKLNNKSINEFLIRGEFINTKNKKDEEKIFIK